MSNIYTPLDQIALKVNELVAVHNNARMPGVPPIEPLDCAPPQSKKSCGEVEYPEYNRSKVDHTTLGG